jgi:hypothetical protein
VPASNSTWSNTIPGSAGGYSGGSSPAYNAGTNTIIFGYTQQTAVYNYAFSQALQNAGLVIGGYAYSWKINNNDANTGTLSGKFTLKDLSGSALQSYVYTYNNRTIGDSENFQVFSGTQWFNKNYPSSQISSFSLEWTGKDDRFWAGYYGPRVRDPSIQLKYLVDVCGSNPLSSPECPGYAEAYKTQQCNANSLYDSSCPGYTVAYHTQQCKISPLYRSDCFGYAEAYKAQQCAINPLYNTSCAGYVEAYFKNQCTINPLYDTACTGYAEAYFNKQCLLNSLYDKKCEGYSTAYAIKYLVTAISPEVNAAVNAQLTTNIEIIKADPAKQTVVSATVDAVLTPPNTTSVTSPTSVTSVLGPSMPAQAALNSSPPKVENRISEQKKSDTEVPKPGRKAEGKPGDAKRGAEQRAKEIAQQASKAATFEAQTAQQGALVSLMGYVPGFSGYQQVNIPDTKAADMAKTYYKPVIDNARAQRLMNSASDRVHTEMVNSQYRNVQ